MVIKDNHFCRNYGHGSWVYWPESFVKVLK